MGTIKHVILFTIVLVSLASLLGESHGKKILSLSVFSSKSHKIVYEPLLIELANRGHEITIVTMAKSKPHKNIKEIVGLAMEDFGVFAKLDLFDMRVKKQKLSPTQVGQSIELACRSYYNMSEVMALKYQHFDLIFVEALSNDCIYGLIGHTNAPYIMISTASPWSWLTSFMGTPSPLSFVPLSMFGYSHDMTFLQRTQNYLVTKAMQAYFELSFFPTAEKIYREYLGEDTPSIFEIHKNVSLMLTGSHFTTTYPRPLMPDIVEVGGMHCRPAEPLPKDLDEFLTGSGNEGFIYFSMGSVLKGAAMPEKARKIFVNAFSKLNQRVLWKWETELMDDLPKNVKLSKWIPQQDVLGHPNIKIFITHGGLGSTIEAVYHGVPLIGLPMFGDQDPNMEMCEKNGFAVILEFSELNEENVLNAVNKILNDPKFTRNAKALSAVYRDRPQNPLDTALYWSEYIMRHKGAAHLRSPARDLNWLEYHSIDVIVFVVSIVLFLLYIVYKALQFICSRICGLGKATSSVKKNS